MTKAIMTMVMMPTLVGMHCENVVLKALTAAPRFHRPAARNTRKLRTAAVNNSGAGCERPIREYIFSALTAEFHRRLHRRVIHAKGIRGEKFG